MSVLYLIVMLNYVYLGILNVKTAMLCSNIKIIKHLLNAQFTKTDAYVNLRSIMKSKINMTESLCRWACNDKRKLSKIPSLHTNNTRYSFLY